MIQSKLIKKIVTQQAALLVAIMMGMKPSVSMGS